jgi:hypothetical protein
MKIAVLYLFAYLQSRPKVGIASGFGGGVIVFLQQMLTDEVVIKMIVAFGACCSSFVALMSVLAWFLKQIRTTRQWLKERKSQIHENNHTI